MRLVLSTDAEADIAEAFEWYEAHQPGVGANFLLEVAAAIEAVQFEPRRFPVVHRSVRRALMHRFPYGVFFVVDAGDEISVIAVMHMARDPGHSVVRTTRSP